MVDPFQNADPQFAEAPPNFLSEYFDHDTRTVSEIAGEDEVINPDKFVQYGIRSSLVLSELGTCTDRHRDIVYARGYEDQSAIILANLASLLVDAHKQGLALKLDKWNGMLHGLKARKPEYVKPPGEHRSPSKHVMDILVLEVLPQFRNCVLKTFHDTVGGDGKVPLDADIRAFYDRVWTLHAPSLAPLTDALQKLRTKWSLFHVKIMNEQSKYREHVQCSPTKQKNQKPVRNRKDQDQLVLPQVFSI